MSEACTITRIGYVNFLGAMHFMADRDGNRTACGRTANHAETVSEERGAMAVECSSCCKINRTL